MPELYSRMDSVNWLTPSVTDILDQGAAPPGGSGSIREYMLMIQRELADLETPARIINVRSSPSYHMFVARPESVGKMGQRRVITPEEIEKSIEKIAAVHADWTLGFAPLVKGEDNAVGILLRTHDHRPHSLRRMLVRDTFRKHPSITAFTCGITLDQQLIVRDIADVGHMLVVGKDTARQHVLNSIMLTFTLMSTPGELRLSLAGDSARAYKIIAGTPHALGRILPDASGGGRLLAGLVKEVQRRQQAFKDENTRTITDYNARQREKNKPDIPRILMVIDSLTDSTWLPFIEEYLPAVQRLLTEGAKVGIHLLLAVDELPASDTLKAVLNHVQTRIILRAAAKDLIKDIPMHRSQLRFIDAFVFEGRMDQRKDVRITPVEVCAISGVELRRVVDYWRSNARQRQTAAASSTMISGKTGVTGLLQTQESAMLLIKPPVPSEPPRQSLEKAARLFAQDRGAPPTDNHLPSASPAASNDTVETMLREMSPDSTRTRPSPSIALAPTIEIATDLPLVEPDIVSPAAETDTQMFFEPLPIDPIPERMQQIIETPVITPSPTPTRSTSVNPAATIKPAAPAVSEAAPPPELAPTVEDPVIAIQIEAKDQSAYTFLPPDLSPLSAPTNGTHASPEPDVQAQARTLAAYLGWLSAGALHDILGVPYDEARQMIEDLKRHNVLENIATPAPRFILPFQKH